MRKHEAPFYLRRTKEALVTFPDPETGEVQKLFTKREVRTAAFELDGEEFDFYDALTRYVEDQSIKAAAAEARAAQALGFTMAMLQRRFASSIYAVRRSLERMRDKRREDPRQTPRSTGSEQIEDALPDDFDDLPEDEQQQIIADLEGVVARVRSRRRCARRSSELDKLIDQARALEAARGRVEADQAAAGPRASSSIFSDPKMKLLIFTEHKDTLDYLAGDGKDGRPLGKLREWGLTVTQIHGGMKIGDRDTPGTRIYAEREFREDAQVLVATEAAGEGINLQFCWLHDQLRHPLEPGAPGAAHGPHPPLRPGAGLPHLQLRRRQHARRPRARQAPRSAARRSTRSSAPTRSSTSSARCFRRTCWSKMFRDMYARRLSESAIEDRIVRDVDPERFKRSRDPRWKGWRSGS